MNVKNDKKDEKKVDAQIPNNVQKTMFEIVINNTEERIKRIQDQNNALLELFEQVQNDITSIDNQTADQIAQLNRQIYTEEAKMDDCQNIVNATEQKRIEEKKDHDNKVISLNQMYHDTQLKLLCKMKILNAKINALEDFRTKQSMLEDKLKHSDELIAQREKQVNEKLIQIFIQFKLDREKLIQTLRKKLFELSKLWTLDRKKRKTPITCRLFRENVIVQQEIDQSALILDNLKYLNSELKSQLNANKKYGIQQKNDLVKSLNAIDTQSKLITLLKKNRQQQIMRNGNTLPISKNALIDYDILIDKLINDIRKSEQEVAYLQNNLYNVNYKIRYAEKFTNLTKMKIETYMNTLYDVKYVIACVLQIGHYGPEFVSMSKRQLILYLEDLIKIKEMQ